MSCRVSSSSWATEPPASPSASGCSALTDWARNGSLAEYAAVEARNLAPLPADIDHTVAAALPISGLTAWQGLFDHGRLRPARPS